MPSQRIRIEQAIVRCEAQTPRTITLPSPVDPARHYQERNILFANAIDFGVQTADSILASMHEVHARGRVQVTLCLKRKELDVQFPQMIDNKKHQLRFRLPISQLSHIHLAHDGNDSSSLIIPFDVSPQFFHQKEPQKDDDSFFPRKERSWRVWNTWFRETDVVDDRTRRQLQTSPLMNHSGSAIIDIGKKTSFGG